MPAVRSDRSPYALIEAAATFGVAIAAYTLMRGEIPYHDVDRFREQIDDGVWVWDIAHILLQPVTLLWHRMFNLGGSTIDDQHVIHAVFTALGLAVFTLGLRRLGQPLWHRLSATVLLGGSCAIITLAPTGHMKLLVLPFLTASLMRATTWEIEYRSAAFPRPLIEAALLLGLAALFLVSALAAGPFLVIAVIIVARRGGTAWPRALAQGLAFGAIALGVFTIGACVGFILFSGQDLSLAGLLSSVDEKASLRPAHYTALLALARWVFGSVHTLIAAPQLGSVCRAVMARQITDAGPYVWTLAGQGAIWLLTASLLAAIYLRAIQSVWHRGPGLVPLAFLAGGLVWAAYYGVDDPEHWFALTAPTILLFCLVMPPRAQRFVLPAWAGVTLAVNLLLVVRPVVTYPLGRYEREAEAVIGPRDLVVNFLAFPGHPYGEFLDLPYVPRLRPDKLRRLLPDDAEYFAELRDPIDATLKRGGRVIIFDVLDPYDWEAPWPMMYARDMSKDKLFGFLHGQYAITRIQDIAGLPTWELRARSTGDAAR